MRALAEGKGSATQLGLELKQRPCDLPPEDWREGVEGDLRLGRVMWVGAKGGAGGGEGEGRWTLEVQVPRAPACQLQTLARGWHRQPVPTPFCLGDGAHEARVAGSQARSTEGVLALPSFL